MKSLKSFSIIIFLILLFANCDNFLDVNQDLEVTEDQIYADWYEYRSVSMGLYALQQDLVEQIVVLGELRADLLTVTENASADLIEINNFNISKNNKYANPTKLFKLISACNNFIRILRENHPEVLDPTSEINNYHKLYGETICMRAWAYFMAVRIYQKVPLIPESIVTIDEINTFINTPGTYIDSVYINFNLDGYYNDTVYNKPIELQRNLYDQELILDYFINQLENEVFAVGVNHFIENNDVIWEIRVWNEYAYRALLGSMYLTQGDYSKAFQNFRYIIFANDGDIRYQLDNTFANNNWKNIFTSENTDEHIFSLNFNKGNQQQNQFQSLFDILPPHTYQMKPSNVAILNWESVFKGQFIVYNPNSPKETTVQIQGAPGDFFRGPGVSYQYSNGIDYLPVSDIAQMFEFRKESDDRSVNNLLSDFTKPVVYKYSINKGTYDEDANFIIYRAASIHLYVAEIYTYWVHDQGNKISVDIFKALNLINDGSFFSNASGRPQKGVRGRVGLGGSNDQIRIGNYRYEHDPYTNEILGFKVIGANLLGKQHWLEEEILEERARELAFEGERFYDLIRIANRRNDPSFLAKMVSAKFPESDRERIYNYLLDENNWYINYFE